MRCKLQESVSQSFWASEWVTREGVTYRDATHLNTLCLHQQFCYFYFILQFLCIIWHVHVNWNPQVPSIAMDILMFTLLTVSTTLWFVKERRKCESFGTISPMNNCLNFLTTKFALEFVTCKQTYLCKYVTIQWKLPNNVINFIYWNKWNDLVGDLPIYHNQR